MHKWVERVSSQQHKLLLVRIFPCGAINSIMIVLYLMYYIARKIVSCKTV